MKYRKYDKGVLWREVEKKENQRSVLKNCSQRKKEIKEKIEERKCILHVLWAAEEREDHRLKGNGRHF